MKLILIAFALIHFLSALAQDTGTVLEEQIWGTVIYSQYGERTPYILEGTNTLTPLGARQMYESGQFYRQRYVDTPPDEFAFDHAIREISPYRLEVNQINVWSTVDQFVIASAQAFMQGLYPPIEDSSNNTFTDFESSLTNGSTVEAPMGGYQYPQIYTASKNDLNSIWINGEVNCPMYTSSRAEYFASPEFLSTELASSDFYANLHDSVLGGIFPNESIGYFNAYYIYDYLNYGYLHNTTISNRISIHDVQQARLLANQWVYAMNGNTTASGSTEGDHIRAVAGRSLATLVREAMLNNIHSSGDLDKMTLLFGSFEPMVAFAALTDLPQREPDFASLPNLGASMAWELFSYATNDSFTYPDEQDLYVRFLFQNGTGNQAQLISYPMFGRSPSQIVMRLEEFIAGMEDFLISDVEMWCNTCSSYSVFCPAFVDSNSGTSAAPGGSSSSGSSHDGGLSNAVAGVIGAIVALVVAGMVLGLAMVIGGFRLYRNHAKKRSELGGFKGGEKLASDPDLTVAKSSVGASVQEAPKGHERIGSWEMGNQFKAQEAANPIPRPTPVAGGRRPSFEDDELRLNAASEPVKPRENV